MSDHESIFAFLDRVKATADAATEGKWQPLNTAPDNEAVLVQFHPFNHPAHKMMEQVAWRFGGQWRTYPQTEGTAFAERWKPIRSSNTTVPQLEQALRVAVEKLEACKNAVELLQGTSSRGAIEFRETLHKIATICHE